MCAISRTFACHTMPQSPKKERREGEGGGTWALGLLKRERERQETQLVPDRAVRRGKHITVPASMCSRPSAVQVFAALSAHTNHHQAEQKFNAVPASRCSHSIAVRASAAPQA